MKYAVATAAAVSASALGLDYLLRPQTPTVGNTSTISSSSAATSVSLSRTSTSVASPPEILDELLEPIRQQYNIPALTAAFVRGPDLAALGAVGVRRLGATVRVQPNDQWHLGSDTKSMTSTLIAMLVEQGKLAWETTVADVFPDLLSTIRPEYHKLTLIELLSHRAGIPGQQKGTNEYDAEFFEIRDKLENSGGTLPQQRRAVIEIVLSKPPVSEPGSLYNYSNHGYVIAGAFAEQVTGQQWEKLIQQMLFKPLGMETAGFGAPGTFGKLDQPLGHTSQCKSLEPSEEADNPPWLGPAGRVHSSMSDWARYASLHLLGAQGKEGLLLKPESFQQLHYDRYHQGYALGWSVRQRSWASGLTLSHTGSNNFWYADIWIAPQRNAALLAATNTADCPSEDVGFNACDAAISAMISRYL